LIKQQAVDNIFRVHPADMQVNNIRKGVLASSEIEPSLVEGYPCFANSCMALLLLGVPLLHSLFFPFIFLTNALATIELGSNKY
jgi:hypothetical protein